MMPRGIRNANPGNIRRVDGVKWVGQSSTITDPAFVTFIDPRYGIRAMVRILRSYQRQGIRTIHDAINRWAPPNENNSDAYVAAVCKECKVQPSTLIVIDEHLPEIVKAIIRHENGQQPYPDEVIYEGISLA